MNECQTCASKLICKIYDSVLPFTTIANIEIKNCLSYNASEVIKNTTPPPLETNPVIEQRRDPSQLISISDEIKKLNIDQAQQEERVCEMLCPECEESYPADAFCTCTSCEVTICNHCKVYYNAKIYCEECFHKERNQP